MTKDELVKKLEEELKKVGIPKQRVLDRAVVISYLARLDEDELELLLEEVKKIRNGVWKPLEETKRYKHKEEVKKDKKSDDKKSKS